MPLLIKLGWRNLFRNTRRTLLSGMIIGIGVAALIFTDGLVLGMTESMVRTATDVLMGHGQIHAEGFRDAMDVQNTIKDRKNLLKKLDSAPEIQAYAPRVMAEGMISSAADVASVVIYGIDPKAERKVSKLSQSVFEGEFFESVEDSGALIGERLAQDLHVTVGDRLILTTAHAKSGEVSQNLFRVKGIYTLGSKDMDQGMVFAALKPSQKLMGVDEGLHEIALRFLDPDVSAQKELPRWKEWSEGGNEALGWNTLMSEMDAMLKMSENSSYIMAVILFAVIAFAVMNTLFMSIYERTFEFGVMQAIGTRPYRIGLMILFEAGSLAVVAMILGSILGVGVNWILSFVGIDYSGIEMAKVTLREPIYPQFRIRQLIEFPLLMFFFTVLSGLYPAWHVSRQRASELMRKVI